MNKLEKRIKEIKWKKYKLLSWDDKFINYEDREGYKYRRYIYDKGNLEDNFKYALSNPYHIDNINLSLLKTNSGTKLKKGTYVSAKNKCTFICGRCGEEFSGLLSNLLKYKYCLCRECVKKVQDTKLLEFTQIEKELNAYGFEMLNDNWEGYHKRIDVKDKSGYKGKVKFDTIRKGGSFSKFALYNPYSLDNVKLFCKLNGFTCVVPNQKFNGWNNDIKIICECGNTYIIELSKLINGKQSRCPRCSNKISKIEDGVNKYLRGLGVEYNQQQVFADCRYKKPLPFDFYLPKLKIAIEVQGEQHYKPVLGFGGEKAFVLQQKKDKIKADYCEYVGIKLLCLSYSDIRSGKYKEIIQQTIFA